MDRVNVGLVGCGAMGRYVARLTRNKSNQIHIGRIYDPNPDSIARTLKSVAPGALVCSSVDELLDSDVDWVMIASWNVQHAKQTIAAFEAGKHVFCQKPLATTVDDCIAMRDAWMASGREFVIGFTLRYSPHYRRIKALIEAGEIGDVISLDFNETLGFNHGGYIMGDWRRLMENAGTHLLEKCCHDIDIINWLLETRARRVASFGGLNFFTADNAWRIDSIGPNEEGRDAYRSWRGTVGENPFTSDKDIVDNQVVILEYDNQVRASFHMNSNAGIPERRLYICGTGGTIRADVIAGKIEVQKIGWQTRTRDQSTGARGGHGNGDDVLAAELAGSMLWGGKPAAGMAEGLDAALTCFAIDQAMDSGEVVSLDEYWSRLDGSPAA